MENSLQIFFLMIIFYISISSTILLCQSFNPFVQPDFEIPKVLETDRFRIRALTVDDVVKDYDAVMTSIDHLQGVFGPNSKWPSSDLTFKQDLVDLGWHQKEFQRRTSFAYAVMSLDESRCLGCVYIEPTKKIDYNAEVYLWVRKSEFENGLDHLLFSSVKEWIENIWPFEKIAFPGREIEWKDWQSLPE